MECDRINLHVNIAISTVHYSDWSSILQKLHYNLRSWGKKAKYYQRERKTIPTEFWYIVHTCYSFA